MTDPTACVFIFFRDLRLVDNITWNYCCHTFQTIYPVFLFQSKEWPSSNQRQFLVESINDLNKQLQNKLCVLSFQDFYDILQKSNIDHVAANINYDIPDRYNTFKTKYNWIEFDDSTLIPIDQYQHKPYQKFTPFYQYMMRTHSIKKPSMTYRFPTHLKKLNVNHCIIKYVKNNNVYVHGGYKNALDQLKKFVKNNLNGYDKNRNYFSIDTSYLSAYLSLNVISIRQVYYATKSSEAFVRELFWREFYIYVIHFFPMRISKYSIKPILTTSQQTKWKAWKNGKTGIELVDACMNQLNTTGYMHNRGRMIVASYLIKNMKIPFQYGEEYFSQKLIDYNKASNNGGWQWVNGTGVDAQPRYQKFNPDIQLKKYDPNHDYVQKWLKS